jgi:hypothetical protein
VGLDDAIRWRVQGSRLALVVEQGATLGVEVSLLRQVGKLALDHSLVELFVLPLQLDKLGLLPSLALTEPH